MLIILNLIFSLNADNALIEFSKKQQGLYRNLKSLSDKILLSLSILHNSLVLIINNLIIIELLLMKLRYEIIFDGESARGTERQLI